MNATARALTESLKSKMTEIDDLKAERQALFSDFEANKERIGTLYYDIELKKLDYMLLKREQLNAFTESEHDSAIVSRVEKINETCIRLLTKKLTEVGMFKEPA